jgi:alginate O-acetyltransferase complex protein AlgI
MFATTLFDWWLSLVIATDDWFFWRRPHSNTRGDNLLSQDTVRSRTQRFAISLSVISNLAVLGFFKYFNFGIATYNQLAAATGQNHLIWGNALHVLLPLGISFYTFQSLSYIIDVYRGDAKAMRNFIDFSCFVSMFPHLVAGPILKFSFLADQIENRTLTREKFARGVCFFCLGMAKKVLIANACAEIADLMFGASSRHTVDAWLGIVAYAFQIYFDFSGYSDMAIGLGLMFGFVFARNFDHPYRAESITDFWRRWHISLSTWLREYLYIPLGGNRKGTLRTYFNLFITMVLGGLWHGASWTFVIWGTIQGIMLIVERLQGKNSLYHKLPRGFRIGATFFVVLISWVFFRANNLGAAISYLRSLFSLQPVVPAASLLKGIAYQPYYLLMLGIGAYLVWRCRDTWEFTQELTPAKAILCFVLFSLSLILLAMQAYNPFIYFVF